MDIKRAISQRKLQANRANAKCSTGPRTEAGKAASRRNALKHGILSRSVDITDAALNLSLRSVKSGPLLGLDILGAKSALEEISRIWDKLARVVAYEKICAQSPAGLEHNARLIHRYECMLTRQLHARIRECAGFQPKA